MPKRFIAHRGKVPPRPGARPTVVKATVVPAVAEIGDAPGPREIGGPTGPEPTRYGDWERKGICVDF